MRNRISGRRGNVRYLEGEGRGQFQVISRHFSRRNTKHSLKNCCPGWGWKLFLRKTGPVHYRYNNLQFNEFLYYVIECEFLNKDFAARILFDLVWSGQASVMRSVALWRAVTRTNNCMLFNTTYVYVKIQIQLSDWPPTGGWCKKVKKIEFHICSRYCLKAEMSVLLFGFVKRNKTHRHTDSMYTHSILQTTRY
jgi:hypothetical protein